MLVQAAVLQYIEDMKLAIASGAVAGEKEFDPRARMELSIAHPRIQEAVVCHSNHCGSGGFVPSALLVSNIRRMKMCLESNRSLQPWELAEASRELHKVDRDHGKSAGSRWLREVLVLFVVYDVVAVLCFGLQTFSRPAFSRCRVSRWWSFAFWSWSPGV